MIGYAWLLMASFENETKYPNDRQVVRVIREFIDDKHWEIQFMPKKPGGRCSGTYCEKRFIEFIPPHYILSDEITGDWQAYLPNLEFVSDFIDYQGLRITLPSGQEHIIRNRYENEFTCLGIDMGVAFTIGRKYNFTLLISKPLTRVLINLGYNL